jgi:ectoine hydroxylase-related dioxygenase (phytanoyl-CoA dioxygenase family)
MDFAAQRNAFDEDGYFVLRGFADPDVGFEMERETVAAIRADPPSAHPDEAAYETDNRLMIMPESVLGPNPVEAEDVISRVYNSHLSGTAGEFARRADVADIVANLIGPDVDVFQSQFIFKNAGAWGQPWHQDSYYFPFRLQPQVGVWLAISEATIENGCLSVLPRSHRPMTIYDHHPDSRPGALYAYKEITDQDTSAAIPMLMQPGDMLVFHSYLLHRSVDNCSNARRSAMVYHYGPANNEFVDPDMQARLSRVHHRVPVHRS